MSWLNYVKICQTTDSQSISMSTCVAGKQFGSADHALLHMLRLPAVNLNKPQTQFSFKD